MSDFEEMSTVKVQQKRKVLQDFINLHYDYVPTYSKKIQTTPILLSFEEYKIQRKLQNLIQLSIVQFVKHYFTDQKLREIVPIHKDIEKLFATTTKNYEAINIGSYRPDFVYDKDSKIRICEINARFALNAYFITDYLTFAVQNLEEFSMFRDTKNFHVYERILSNFDSYKPIGCLRKREKGYDMNFMLKKNSLARSVSPDDLVIKNGKIHDKFGPLEQFILELHQDEIIEMPLDILKHLLNHTKCYNDLRTIFLIHDKRFLKFLSDEQLLSQYINAEDAEFLSKHIITTQTFNENHMEKYLSNHKELILKPFLKGKGEGILFGKDFNMDEWKKLILENQDSCVIQQYIPPKLIAFDVESDESIKSYKAIPIVGTFLGMNDQYLGPGIYRISPSDIIAVSRGGGIIIPLVRKLRRDINVTSFIIDKESQYNKNRIYEVLKKDGIVSIQLTSEDDGTFMNNLVSTFGKSQNYWDIKFDPTQDASICARSKTLREFEFHTDASFYDPPPNYIAIFVVKPDEFGGGVFKMIRIEDILKSLSKEEIELLKMDYEFSVPEEFKRNEKWMKGKILFKENGIRYRSDIISRKNLDEKCLNILKKLDSLIDDEKNHQLFDLKKNSILIFDNTRFLHARSEIKDKNRFLKRIQFDGK